MAAPTLALFRALARPTREGNMEKREDLCEEIRTTTAAMSGGTRETTERRPIDVAHNIGIRLARLEEWVTRYDVPFLDQQAEDGRAVHWLARLPAEILCLVLDDLALTDIVALLTAGSPHLLALALVTNRDLTVDALWWHMWNLPLSRTSHDNALGHDTRTVSDGCGVQPTDKGDDGDRPSEGDGDERERTEWMHGGCRSRTFCTPGRRYICRPLAIDDAHPVHVYGADWDDSHVAFARDPNGIAALALSCARLCTPRVYRQLALLIGRPRTCCASLARPSVDSSTCVLPAKRRRRETSDPLSLCFFKGDTNQIHQRHVDVIAHIAAQRVYLGDPDITWLDAIPNCGRLRWSMIDRHTVRGHMARAALVTDLLGRVPTDRRWTCVQLVVSRHGTVPLALWLPVAAAALDRGGTEHAQRLLWMGIRGTLAQSFVDDAHDGMIGPVSWRAIDSLSLGQRPAVMDDVGMNGPCRRAVGVCPKIARAVTQNTAQWLASALASVPPHVDRATTRAAAMLALDLFLDVLCLLEADPDQVESLRAQWKEAFARHMATDCKGRYPCPCMR